MGNPAFMEIVTELQTVMTPGDPFLFNADAETLDRFTNVQERMVMLSLNAMTDGIGDALTPEQHIMAMEAQLAAMGEMPIVSPNTFELLGLSDDQRQQMENIKGEFEPDFERNLGIFVRNQRVMTAKTFEEIERQGGLAAFGFAPGADPERIREFSERMQGLTETLMQDPEYKRLHDEIQNSGSEFSAQFRMRMFDVLNDEQWLRLQELTDNPPEHARVFIAKLREQNAMGGQASGPQAASGGWQPGPTSWRPGDPIPATYSRERNPLGTFPRAQPQQ